jgi:hypothetical protein
MGGQAARAADEVREPAPLFRRQRLQVAAGEQGDLDDADELEPGKLADETGHARGLPRAARAETVVPSVAVARTVRRLGMVLGVCAKVCLTQRGRTQVRPLRSNPQTEGVPVLRQGHSVRVGRITCTSLRRGMRCRARPSGHGFLAARGAIRRF